MSALSASIGSGRLRYGSVVDVVVGGGSVVVVGGTVVVVVGATGHGVRQLPDAPQHELIAQTSPGAQSLVLVHDGVKQSRLPFAQTPHSSSVVWKM